MVHLRPNPSFFPQGYRECNGDYRGEEELEHPSLPLYQHQQKLPKLPVPMLDETCAIYLRTVRALVSDDEYENTKQAVYEFLKPGGIGMKLQERLLLRAKDRQNSSYLVEWWNKYGYLQVRDPVVINVSYFFHFADSPHPEQNTQTGRAAALLRATMEFRNQTASGTRPPETVGKAKTPLCSTAYKYIFNACRIPQLVEDSYRIYDPALHNHVVVMRHNKFFVFDIYCPKTGQTLSFDEIELQLQRIIQMAGSKESAIGALTSQDRDAWATAREQLLKDGNENVLRVIESAIVMLNLDDTSPVSRKQVARALWHGDGRNRFYDKTVELIVFENGKAGILAEHSLLDGMAMAVYSDFMISGLHEKKIDFGRPSHRELPPPEHLCFTFSKQTLKNINRAQQAFDTVVAAHEVHVESFYGYGKSQIKQFKCSPDAFIQLAIQLAYRKFFGCNRATYEATQTRPYLHGRTETTRSVSIELVDWAKSMLNANATREERRSKLYKAATAHVNYMKRAAKSSGCDRHLLGLQLCLHPGESAALFQDPSYKVSKHWNISTSHLTNERFDGWGWGEVVPDGIGVAYMIKNDSCHFNVACLKNDWAAPYCHLVEESLLEMKLLVQPDELPSSKL